MEGNALSFPLLSVGALLAKPAVWNRDPDGTGVVSNAPTVSVQKREVRTDMNHLGRAPQSSVVSTSM